MKKICENTLWRFFNIYFPISVLVALRGNIRYTSEEWINNLKRLNVATQRCNNHNYKMIPTFFRLEFVFALAITYSMRYRMTDHTASERQSAGAETTAGTPLAGYSGTEERDGIPDCR